MCKTGEYTLIENMLFTFKDPAGREYAVDMDDKRFRIKPYQQMLSSCSGALLTSLLSEYTHTQKIAE